MGSMPGTVVSGVLDLCFRVQDTKVLQVQLHLHSFHTAYIQNLFANSIGMI